MTNTKNKRKTSSEDDNVYPIFKKKPKPTSTDDKLEEEFKRQDPDSLVNFDADEALTAFQRLLDFSQLARLPSKDDKEEEIKKRFTRISETLMRCFRIVVRRAENGDQANNVGKDVEFEILEAEMYLLMGDGLHEDPFTHGSEEQKISGRWYFHRAPKFSKDSTRSLTSNSEYRGGSRKGLDLTLGGAPSTPMEQGSSSTVAGGSPSINPLCGGILLRTIRELKTRKIISGPSLLVDQILSASGASDINDLVETKWGGDIDAFSPSNTTRTCLYLKAIPNPASTIIKAPPIYYSPRIGLDLSHPGTKPSTVSPLHPRIKFLPRRYRFFIHPELLTANGRPQTFLGVLFSIIESKSTSTVTPDGFMQALKKPGLSKRVAGFTGLKDSTAERYLKDYIVGREGGAKLLDQEFVGSRGKGAASSPVTYLKMMGAISALEIV